ncbi:uncharacterized protein PG998_004176 [Apiospora kogelbergensis]|uniref:uncharacterized protein n=1 Tax=Apiospora kogelbergensis TaxID=1337665 RepID=UPI00312F9766
MAKQDSSNTTGRSSSFGASGRLGKRPDYRVQALLGPREMKWAALDVPQEAHQLSRHDGYRDGHSRSSNTAAQHERQKIPRREMVIPPLPPIPQGGRGVNWFSTFRGSKEREKPKETKSYAFDQSSISHPRPADPAFVRGLKESQRQLYEPFLTEMGLSYEINREPMKLRLIIRHDMPEEPLAAQPKQHLVREQGGPLSSNRPAPIAADNTVVNSIVHDDTQTRHHRRHHARDSGDILLSRLSTTAVIDEPNGVVNPQWMPRHIDAVAAGYTGFPDWSSNSDASEQTCKEEPPRTSRRNKRFGRIFTSEDLTKLTEFPEPAPFADEAHEDDGEKPLDASFDVAKKDDEEKLSDTNFNIFRNESDHGDAGVVEERFNSDVEELSDASDSKVDVDRYDYTSDDEQLPDASDSEVDVDRYDYTVGKKDQGLAGEILSKTRRRPSIVVLPPTPLPFARPLPPLPPSAPGPDRARLRPVDWKAAFEEERYLLGREEAHFKAIQRISVPMMVAFEEIVNSSPEFKHAPNAMAIPPILRKILEERDEAMAEADMYVHRSLGLETQLDSLMAELRDLRAQNRILTVDNQRLRNARGGLPLKSEFKIETETATRRLALVSPEGRY